MQKSGPRRWRRDKLAKCELGFVLSSKDQCPGWRFRPDRTLTVNEDRRREPARVTSRCSDQFAGKTSQVVEPAQGFDPKRTVGVLGHSVVCCDGNAPSIRGVDLRMTLLNKINPAVRVVNQMRPEGPMYAAVISEL